MRLAVVIPLFNHETFIARTLESVLAQSRPAHRIIVAGKVTGNIHALERIELHASALVQGDITSFMGFNFITIGDRSEGGLTGGGSGSTRKVYAYHKMAVGMAESMAIRSEINYIPEKTSWLVSSMFSAGAIAIDAGGCVDITCTE